MTFERGNMQKSRIKSIAIAAGLGLAALIPSAADAAVKHSGLGIGYKAAVAEMPYEEVISSVKTPKEAKFYRDNYLPYATDQETYGQPDYKSSFKEIHAKGQDDCDGVSFAMAALLADDGYAPQVLFLKKKVSMFEQAKAHEMRDFERANKDNDYHTIYPYQDKQTGKWGCIGVGMTEDRDAKYDSLEAMVKTIKPRGGHYAYEINSKRYDNGLLRLDDEYGRDTWIAGNGELKDTDGYNPSAYGFISREIQKVGYTKATKDAIVDAAIESQGIFRPVAERHYKMAYNSAESSAKQQLEIMKRRAADKALRDAAASTVAASGN